MTLDKKRAPQQVSKVLKLSLPTSAPNMKDELNTVLADGWVLSTSYYDSVRDEVRFIFVRPKGQR
jgi:hypothetical protein